MSDKEYHNSVNGHGTYSPTDGNGFYVGGSWGNEGVGGKYRITPPLDEHCESVDMRPRRRGPKLRKVERNKK